MRRFSCVCGSPGHFSRKLWVWLVASIAYGLPWDSAHPSLELDVAECAIDEACQFAVEHCWYFRDGWEWINGRVFVLARWRDELGPPRAYRVGVEVAPLFSCGVPVTEADWRSPTG